MNEDRRGSSIGENTITIKTWAVVTLLFIFIAGVTSIGFASLMNHESRISIGETKMVNIQDGMNDIKCLLKDIRQDQLDRYKKEGSK